MWPTGPRPIRSALRGRLYTSPVSTLAVTSVAAQGRRVSGLSGGATRSPTHSPPHTHTHTSPSRQSALRRLVGPTQRAGVTVWQGMGTAFVASRGCCVLRTGFRRFLGYWQVPQHHRHPLALQSRRLWSRLQFPKSLSFTHWLFQPQCHMHRLPSGPYNQINAWRESVWDG